MNTEQTTTAAGVVTRAKREAAITIGLRRQTEALRSLASGQHTMAEARQVRDRYARGIGAKPGAGGDALLTLLMSSEATRIDIEDLDYAMHGPIAEGVIASLLAGRAA